MKTDRLLISKDRNRQSIKKANGERVWWLKSESTQSVRFGDTIARFFVLANSNIRLL